MKRQHATLLELIIAMSLVLVLMSILFGYYIFVSHLHRKFESTIDAHKQVRHTYHRLEHLVGSIQHYTSLNKKDSGNFFYTSLVEGKESLVLSYDNGVDINPNYTGKVLARLFLSNQGELTLLTWPLFSEDAVDIEEYKKEILLKDIDSIAFRFIVPEHLEGKLTRGEHREWLKSYSHFPLSFAIDLYLKNSELPMTYTFEFSRKLHPYGDPRFKSLLGTYQFFSSRKENWA